MRQGQPLRQEADVAEIAHDAIRGNSHRPRRADRWSPADACECAGRSAPNSPRPLPAAASNTTARRRDRVAHRPSDRRWPRRSHRSVRCKPSATSARGRTVPRWSCGRRRRVPTAPALRCHRRSDSGRAPQSQRRCGCRHRTPRARFLSPLRPAAWCRSASCNAPSSPHTRPAPNAPARKPRSDRDRRVCRAPSAGSSFPAACRSRRRTMRSAARGRGH